MLLCIFTLAILAASINAIHTTDLSPLLVKFLGGSIVLLFIPLALFALRVVERLRYKKTLSTIEQKLSSLFLQRPRVYQKLVSRLSGRAERRFHVLFPVAPSL